MDTITETNFQFPKQTGFYRGKVRDIYYFDKLIAIVATDRISAFDVILPKPIPNKGRILNTLSAHHIQITKDIIPNWVIDTPDPNVSIGYYCQPIPIEMIVRGYIAGHAWREYASGKRQICNETLPDGLSENDALPNPILTPSSKAHVGHDEDLSEKSILNQGILTKKEYQYLKETSLLLYKKGAEEAQKKGLILADTKYEFGKRNNVIYLIDEVHTPDSSRFFYHNGFYEKQKNRIPQPQLSKEFVRKWLMKNGFQGKPDQAIPPITDLFVQSVTEQYEKLFYLFTGQELSTKENKNIMQRIEQNIINYIT